MISTCFVCRDECRVMKRSGIYDNAIDIVYDVDYVWSFLHCLYLVTLCGQLFHLCIIPHQSAASSCVHDLQYFVIATR